MKKTCLFSLFVLFVASCGGGDSGTGTVSEDQVTVTSPGGSITLPMTVAWPKAVTASSVTADTFFMADGGAASAMVVKDAYDPTHCVAASAIAGTITTSDTGLETTFTPTGGVWPVGRLIYACLTSGIGFNDGSTFAGKTASFQTPAFTATLTSRTSVTQATDGSGSSVLTFTFDSAPGVTPTMSVQNVSSGEAAGGVCEAAAGDTTGTAFTCTASGLASCKTITDYQIALLLGSSAVKSFTINAADDLFDSGETLTNGCWTAAQVGLLSSAAIADDKLTLHADANALAAASYSLLKSADKDASIAVTAELLSFDRPGVLMLYVFARSMLKSDVTATQQMEFRAGSSDTNLFWAVAYPALSADPFGPAGDLLSTATWAGPFYLCMSRYNNLIYSFVSFDGTTFTQLGSTNINCGADCGTLFPVDSSGWNFTQSIQHQIVYNISAAMPPAAYAGDAVYDWVMYKTSGLAGTEADCPRM